MFRLCYLTACILLTGSFACNAAGLPDTGQELCHTGSGIDPRPPSNLESVARDTGEFPRQDCRYGRDPAANAGIPKTGAGAKGFDYFKITNISTMTNPAQPLGPNAFDWACTLDQTTGLMWEVKTLADINSLRNANHTYTWSSPDFTTNGGNSGSVGFNSCNMTLGSQCNTAAYVNAVNASYLCTYTDWRLPSRRELLTLIHTEITTPAVDPAYFIYTNTTPYWSATTASFDPANAIFVDFAGGMTNDANKATTRAVRLVRGPAY